MPMKAENGQIGQYGEFGENLNIPPLISQHSYQISSQMRWHPLATDKTYLSLKNEPPTPIDNREIEVHVLTTIP